MSMELPAGAIGLNERLQRLEDNDQRILVKLETLAKATDVESLRLKVEHIEQRYVSKGTVWGLALFAIAESLVIIGLGLGFVYEIVRRS